MFRLVLAFLQGFFSPPMIYGCLATALLCVFGSTFPHVTFFTLNTAELCFVAFMMIVVLTGLGIPEHNRKAQVAEEAAQAAKEKRP